MTLGKFEDLWKIHRCSRMRETSQKNTHFLLGSRNILIRRTRVYSTQSETYVKLNVSAAFWSYQQYNYERISRTSDLTNGTVTNSWRSAIWRTTEKCISQYLDQRMLTLYRPGAHCIHNKTKIWGLLKRHWWGTIHYASDVILATCREVCRQVWHPTVL